MPANSTGWQTHCIARETGRLGHLFSPGAERTPYPWLPYSLDNGAFSCWNRQSNVFNDEKWAAMLPKWERLLFWAQCQEIKARWAIVPDVIGNAPRTLKRWAEYAPTVQAANIPLALAVQNGMTVQQVRRLEIQPEVIAVGGTDEFKWNTVAQWVEAFPRVHLLRCCSPAKLYELEAMGVESCDGTGWFQGDEKQTKGLEKWAYSRAVAVTSWPTDYKRTKKRSESKQLLLA
jgi:hypothetical protein